MPTTTTSSGTYYATLALTVDGDLDLAMLVVRGRDAVLAEAGARLRCMRGSYAWDLAEGVDPVLVSGYLGWYGGAEAEIERTLRTVPGVAGVEVRLVSEDRATRTRTYAATLSLEDGTTTSIAATSLGGGAFENVT